MVYNGYRRSIYIYGAIDTFAIVPLIGCQSTSIRPRNSMNPPSRSPKYKVYILRQSIAIASISNQLEECIYPAATAAAIWLHGGRLVSLRAEL